MQKWKAAAIAAVVLAVCFTVLFLFNQLPDQNVRRQIDKGNRYLESADYERAILAYQAAVEIDPQNIDAYLGLADSYRQQAGSYDEDETEKIIASYDHSSENYESAIRLDQDNIDPYLSLIQVYENAAECMDGIDESAKEEYQEKALEVAKRAARIDPSDEMVKSVIEKGAEDVADQAAEDENSSNSSEAVRAESETEKSDDFTSVSYEITRDDRSFQTTANDGTSVTIPVYYDLLQITDDSYPYKDEVNAYLQEKRDEFFEYASLLDNETIAELPINLTPDFLATIGDYMSLTNDKVYCGKSVLSANYTWYAYTGERTAELENTHPSGCTIDLRTGSALSLLQLTHTSLEECQQMIIDSAVAKAGAEHVNTTNWQLDETDDSDCYIDSANGHICYVGRQFGIIQYPMGDTVLDLGEFTGLQDPENS